MSTPDSDQAQTLLAKALDVQVHYNIAYTARERGWRDERQQDYSPFWRKYHLKSIDDGILWAETTLCCGDGTPLCAASSWFGWVHIWSQLSDEQQAEFNPIRRVAYEIIQKEWMFRSQTAATSDLPKLVQRPQPGDEEQQAAFEAATARKQWLLSGTVTVHHQDGTSEEVSLQELHDLILDDAPRLSPVQQALIDENRLYGG